MSRVILLADDSVTIQRVVELTFVDDQVIAASDGDEAIAKLGELSPDLVLADIHMPGASGYDVCRKAKELHPDVPVMLLVGTFEPFDRSEAESCGADATFKKPFDSQDLARKADDLVSGAEPAGGAAEIEEPADDDDPFQLLVTPDEDTAEAEEDPEKEEEDSADGGAGFGLGVKTTETLFGGDDEEPATRDESPPPTGSVFEDPAYRFDEPTVDLSTGLLDEDDLAPGQEIEPAEEPPALSVTEASDDLAEEGETPSTGEQPVWVDLEGRMDAPTRELSAPQIPIEPGDLDEGGDDESATDQVVADLDAAAEAEDDEEPVFRTFGDLEDIGASDSTPVAAEIEAVDAEDETEEVEEADEPAGSKAEVIPVGDVAAFRTMDSAELEDEEDRGAAAAALDPWAVPLRDAADAEAAEDESAEPGAAEEAVTEADEGVDVPAGRLSDEDVERIARRVADLLADTAVREVAWEVIPDLAEVVIKERIEELERQV